MYESFEGFLQAAIRQYYERSGAKNRTRLVALLILSGEAVPMAVDALKGAMTPGRLAVGAVGALALRAGLRWVFAGPLGLLVTGVTVTSLIAYYFTHQSEIAAEVGHTRRTVEQVSRDYHSLQERFAAGRFNADERNLMIDGLLQRFLRNLDNPQAADAEVVVRTPDEPGKGSC